MAKVIRKTKNAILLNEPSVEYEIKYNKRESIKDIFERCRNKEIDMILMTRVCDLSRDPVDVKAACKEIAKMKVGITFYKENLTGEVVLKMSDEDLLKITMANLEDDMVIILDFPEEGAEYISEEKQNIFQQIMQ